jgi:YgiT-type zinc finger domain-containing protein
VRHKIGRFFAKVNYEFSSTFLILPDACLIFQSCFCKFKKQNLGKMMKALNNGYNYGQCEICYTPLQEQRINQDFWIKGQLIVVENVPTGVCPRCGEKVVKADVGKWIAELIKSSERIAKAPRISVPAIKFEPEGIAV